MPGDTKLSVLVRVEPGSLGPDGLDHVEGYCVVANKYFQKLYPQLIEWQIVPRYDKSLPEIDFCLNKKRLTLEQTNKMLELIDQNEEDFESETMEHISNLIDKYLGHQY
ncbi:hypothetical protein [Psychrosphaera haliotis]|uniref:Uncharacterized protein n=1 Tax=Psychrosphaera haliotis TaxID=555083 RepID=A0A6N8F841_9GAMM|nr:hypothetical protein [Psychrosphaera haliotis]MDB2373646.1 hypothetical protein [Psychrosphaera haliotis]MUH71050.1 hypothetical protein [Psychrosphaera haliotis]